MNGVISSNGNFIFENPTTIRAEVASLLKTEAIAAVDIVLLAVIERLAKKPKPAPTFATNRELARYANTNSSYVSQRLKVLSGLGLVLIWRKANLRCLECQWSRTEEERLVTSLTWTIENTQKPEPIEMTIYFVQSLPDGPIKIGRTGHLQKRMLSLQASSSSPLRLLGFLITDYTKEQELHAKFKQHRLHGEWFKPDKEILEFVKENCDAVEGAVK